MGCRIVSQTAVGGKVKRFFGSKGATDLKVCCNLFEAVKKATLRP
jgi:hypothetical protein